MKWSKQVVVTVGAVVIRECGVGSNLGVGGSWELVGAREESTAVVGSER